MSSRILILVSRFNDLITRSLLTGAEDTLKRAGISSSDIETVWVPGSFELPAAAAKAARSKHFGAVICLGAVIRGETPHFDYVAGQAAAGLMRVSIETEIPVIFGVLTTETIEQALSRSGVKGGNKGCDAAQTALEMMQVMTSLDRATGKA